MATEGSEIAVRERGEGTIFESLLTDTQRSLPIEERYSLPDEQIDSLRELILDKDQLRQLAEGRQKAWEDLVAEIRALAGFWDGAHRKAVSTGFAIRFDRILEMALGPRDGPVGAAGDGPEKRSSRRSRT